MEQFSCFFTKKIESSKCTFRKSRHTRLPLHEEMNLCFQKESVVNSLEIKISRNLVSNGIIFAKTFAI